MEEEAGGGWKPSESLQLRFGTQAPGVFSHSDTCNDAISCFLSVPDGALTRRLTPGRAWQTATWNLTKCPLCRVAVCLSERCHHTPPPPHCASKYNVLFSFLWRLYRKAANPRGQQVSCVPITNPVTGVAICCDKVSWPWVIALRGIHAWQAAM